MRTASSRGKRLAGASPARWRIYKLRRYAKRLRTAPDLRLSCPHDCARGITIDNGLFPEAPHRESTFKCRAAVGARTGPEADRFVSGIRAEVAGIGTNAVAGIGEAPRFG